jgi:hypothetical protein
LDNQACPRISLQLSIYRSAYNKYTGEIMKRGAKIVSAAVICLLVILVGCVGLLTLFMAPVALLEGGIPFAPPEEALEIEEGRGPPRFAMAKVSNVVWPERMVIQKAWLSLEVDNLEKASDRITELTQDMNGFIADSKAWVTSAGQRKGKIKIRIPKNNFLQTIEEIEKLGKVESKEISGEDITEEYVDLEARLKNFKQEEESLLGILGKAKKVPDILEVEKELARVRRKIEEITGRMEYLENRVELSTITISLHEPEPITPKGKNAFHASYEGFLSMINGIIIFFGYALPVLIIIGVIGAIVIGCKRAYKSKLRPKLKKK